MTEEIQHLTAAEERHEHSSAPDAVSNPATTAESAKEHAPAAAPAVRKTDDAVADALFASNEPSATTEPPASAPEFEAPPLLEPIDSESFLPELSADHLAPLPPTAVLESEPAATPEAALPRPRIVVDALSDVGCVRTNNEDAYGYDSELGLFVICDGMGGMAAGEVASSNAVSALVNTFAESAGTSLPISTRLQQAVHTANTTVWNMGQQPEHKGMGTTAVAAAIEGQKLIIANVGDSRAYAFQNGLATQITIDHSYINELIRNGTLTKENAHLADLHGYESVITRAIGVSETVEPDYYSIDLTPGTEILLATDGLTRYLNGDEIATILQATPFESTCANLIDLAKRRGGHDNITCLLLLVLPPESASQTEPPAA
jgi:serine/threonine protein phosphatase PrpC